jgi:hypothetical protein
VNGTPTFFINGERYDGAWGLEPWLRALEKHGPAQGHGKISGADDSK